MSEKKNSLFKTIINNKKNQPIFLTLMVSYAVLLATITGVFDFESTEITTNVILTVLSAAVLILSLSKLAFRYLEGNNNVSVTITGEQNEIVNEITLEEHRQRILASEKQNRRERLEFREILEKLQNDINTKPEIQFRSEDYREIFSEVKNSIEKNINQEFFDKLNDNISILHSREKKKEAEYVMKFAQSITFRLVREISKLDRKSNINLIIGSTLTIVALIFLGLIVYDKPIINLSISELIIHYLPRISFIVFIEVFAYFFLRLYKLNLIDIKYYQNELTNIDLKVMAALSAFNVGKEADVSTIILELSKTERNFILEKGQTTVEFEKFKHDQKSIEKFAKIFKNIIPKSK